MNKLGKLALGDKYALLDLMKDIAPGWAAVSIDQYSAVKLTGGMSGAALWRLSATAEPREVVVRVSAASGEAKDPLAKLMFVNG